MTVRTLSSPLGLCASVALGLALVLASACGDEDAGTSSVATVTPIRGDVSLAGAPAARVARAAAGDAIAIGGGALARVRLDVGPELLAGESSALAVDAEGGVQFDHGRVFVDVAPGDRIELTTPKGMLRVADAAVSVESSGETISVYAVRGEVPYSSGDAHGVLRAGERLTLSGGAPATEAALLFHDWTGGLARPGPTDDPGPRGVGTLEARVPDEIGLARWPLSIQRLDVRVRIDGDLAITEVEQVFFNPASEAVEGLYRVHVPEDAVLSRFAVDRNGTLVDGYVRERAQAQQAYEQQVYRGSTDDPALLEWDAPGAYRARIYPIAPGEARRIVIRYAEWLTRPAPGAPRLYRYPMAGGERAPRVQELSIVADVSRARAASVRAGMGADVGKDAVELRMSDFTPRADFWLELVDAETPALTVAQRARHEPPQRAPGSRIIANEADERDYWLAPLMLPPSFYEGAASGDALDLVVVADVSAATDRAHLELGRSLVESLLAHLGGDDRVAVVTSDSTIHDVEGGAPELGPATPERVDRLLDGLSRARAGGATDLGAAIASAAALLDPTRAGAVVYVGDGAPTVGELAADALLERLGRLPSPVRLYAVGVGSDANLELLEALTRGGGLALRVEERASAADAALRILAHATRPIAHRVTVDLGPGIDNAFPRGPVDVVMGEPLHVVGRIRDDPPDEVTVHGVVGGHEVQTRIQIATNGAVDPTDLRLRWAGERLRQLLLDGATREEVAELGTRYGSITPFTSYYVPSARELAAMGPSASVLLDKPGLQVAGLTGSLGTKPARAQRGGGSAPLALARTPAALLPLVIAACNEEPAQPPETTVSSVEPQSNKFELDEETEGEVAPDETARRPRTRTAGGDVPPPEAAPQALEAPGPTVPAGSAEAWADGDDGMPSHGAVVAGQTGAPTNGGGSGGGANLGPATGTGLGSLGYIGHRDPDGTNTAPVVDDSGLLEEGSRHEAPDPTAADALRRLGYDDGARGSEVAQNRPGFRRETSLGSDPIAALGALLDTTVADNLGRAGNERGGARYDVVVRTTIVTSAHRPRRCSDAADLLIDDRRALWRERLGNTSSPSEWAEVYANAIRDCEAPTWRDRRALLTILLEHAGSVPRMLQLYSALSDGSARGFLRAAILRRVRSPEDLRAVRDAFRLTQDVDWELVQRVIERATTPAARVRALRDLVDQMPFSFDLKLRLLDELEHQGRIPEAKRLADRLRTDPLADPGVRTAVGEMYLRVGDEDEARRVFSEIVEFAPLDELARRRLGDLYRAHGWFDEAYRQYLTLAEIRPDDPSVLLLVAQAAAGAGRIDEALRLEQRVAETAAPGSIDELARTALLWSSVRYAKLRDAARRAHDDERLEALFARMRRSGVLGQAGDLRVSLVWSHPDARISLWASHPGLGLSRPTDISPELGIEAFDVVEAESGTYRIEVRRPPPESGFHTTAVEAELVVVWHEGQDDEKVEVVPVRFEPAAAGTAGPGDLAFAWTIEGRELRQAPPEGWGGAR